MDIQSGGGVAASPAVRRALRMPAKESFQPVLLLLSSV